VLAYLEDVITYLDKIGFFTVLLPFILIFSVVFAILEKTKIFGTENIGGTDFPRRNVNLIVSFSISLFAVASATVIDVLTKALGPIIILIFVAVFSIVFIGVFGQEADWKTNKAVKYYAGALVIGVLAIFLWALDWLDEVKDYFESHTNLSNLIGVIILFGVIALSILWITQPGSSDSKGKDKEKKD